MHTTFNTELTVGQLHDVPLAELKGVIVYVSKRRHSGGRFQGVSFLNEDTDIAHFQDRDDALTFIDNLHAGGIPAAIRWALAQQTGRDESDIDAADIVAELPWDPDMDPTEYLDTTEIDDPLALDICPVAETTRPLTMSVETGLTPVSSPNSPSV